MKILWIDLNCSYAHSSLALPALHAQMKENPRTASYTWNVISGTINENRNHIINKAYKLNPDIIAATAWLFTREQLLHIIARIKALLPQCIIILGGPEFLGRNEDFLRIHPYINCVFRGEGEEQFPYWLEQYNRPTEWNEIPGLCWLDAQGKYQDNGIARVANIELLKSPEESRFFNWEKPFVQLETTRGCFNTCSFCVSGGGKPVRSIHVTAIRKRLENIHRHGIRNVRVLDRTFNHSSQRAQDLLSLFLKFYPDICFHLEIHPAFLTEKLKDLLSSLPKGLLHLEAGIQSLRAPVLDYCHRSGDIETSLAGLQYLCQLSNLETHADLIAGLPLYHLDEIFEDVRTLAFFGASEIQLESLKVLPGTEMRKIAKESGISYSHVPPYEVLKSNEMSPDDIQTAMYLSRLLDGYYNTPTWREITTQLILENDRVLYDFMNFLIEENVIEQPLSLEKRGILLYRFCKRHLPKYRNSVTIAWVKAGMSLKKEPAEHILTKRQIPPKNWDILEGTYSENFRLCSLPSDPQNYWFGFDSESPLQTPIFIALEK